MTFLNRVGRFELPNSRKFHWAVLVASADELEESRFSMQSYSDVPRLAHLAPHILNLPSRFHDREQGVSGGNGRCSHEDILPSSNTRHHSTAVRRTFGQASADAGPNRLPRPVRRMAACSRSRRPQVGHRRHQGHRIERRGVQTDADVEGFRIFGKCVHEQAANADGNPPDALGEHAAT